MNRSIAAVLRPTLSIVGLMFFFAMASFAQDPFTPVATGFQTTAVNIAKILATIALIAAGFSLLVDHSHNVVAKVGGMAFGLIILLFATPLVTWVSGL